MGTDFQEVDGCTGITVVCGDTSCVFEFVTYKYTGKTEEARPVPKTITLEELLGPPPPGNEREDTPDNDRPVFIKLNHSESVPESHRYPAQNRGYPDPSLTSSLPPTMRPQYSIPSGEYSSQRYPSQFRPALQRRHTFDQASSMGSQFHRPPLQYQHSVNTSPLESEVAVHTRSQAGSFDSNRFDSNRSSYMLEEEGVVAERVGGGKGEWIGNSGTGRVGGVVGIRRRGRGGVVNGSGREGATNISTQQLNGRRGSQRSWLQSSTSTVLSSIEDEDESEVTTAGSPQPVFEDSKETQ